MFSLVPRTVVRYAREADTAEGLVGNCQHARRWHNGPRLATGHGDRQVSVIGSEALQVDWRRFWVRLHPVFRQEAGNFFDLADLRRVRPPRRGDRL